MSEISSSVNFTCRSSLAWTPGSVIGMRPVPIWKSTEAAPTPARLGPAWSMPRPLAPWQVAQLATKSFLPLATLSALATEAVASLGATAEYAVPVTKSPSRSSRAIAAG